MGVRVWPRDNSGVWPRRSRKSFWSTIANEANCGLSDAGKGPLGVRVFSVNPVTLYALSQSGVKSS